jgi:hypothetical protein
MLKVGFEPTITASERAKTLNALDRSPTVTGRDVINTVLVYSLRCLCGGGLEYFHPSPASRRGRRKGSPARVV